MRLCVHFLKIFSFLCFKLNIPTNTSSGPLMFSLLSPQICYWIHLVSFLLLKIIQPSQFPCIYFWYFFISSLRFSVCWVIIHLLLYFFKHTFHSLFEHTAALAHCLLNAMFGPFWNECLLSFSPWPYDIVACFFGCLNFLLKLVISGNIL